LETKNRVFGKPFYLWIKLRHILRQPFIVLAEFYFSSCQSNNPLPPCLHPLEHHPNTLHCRIAPQPAPGNHPVRQTLQLQRQPFNMRHQPAPQLLDINSLRQKVIVKNIH